MGPFVFLSMQFPRFPNGQTVEKLWDLDEGVLEDLSTGSEHRDGREGTIRAAVWTTYERIAEILESVGSSLDEIVRQRVVLSDPSDIVPADDVLGHLFDYESLPSTVFNCESSIGRRDSRTLGVEIIAFRKREGADLTRIRIPELSGLTDPYPQATRVDQLLFSSSIWAGTRAWESKGRGSRTELKSLGGVFAEQTHRPLRSQLLETYVHLEVILEAADAGLPGLLRQTFFTKTDRQAWGFTSIEREGLFPEPSDFPTSAALEVPRLLPDPTVALVTDAIALVGERWTRRATVLSEVVMGHLPMVVSAGPFVFTTGYVGMDKGTHATVASYADLGGPEVQLGNSYDDRWEALRAQTWHIYRQIIEILEQMGCTADRVIQQNVYLTDVSAFPVVEAVAASVFGEAFPATSVMGVLSLGPYPGALIEIDVIAVR